MTANRNSGWMSLELANIIDRVVNDCKVCQKFQNSVARPRVTLLKASLFNEVVTLDLKDFGNKYVLWMIDSFSRFMVGKLLNNKKADTIIQAIIYSWFIECWIRILWILCGPCRIICKHKIG